MTDPAYDPPPRRMDFDTWRGRRRHLLDQLEAMHEEARAEPDGRLWLNPATGAVYDREVGGEPVQLRPAAIGRDGQIIYEIDPDRRHPH